MAHRVKVGEKKYFFFWGGIKIGREYIRKWVICGKTHSGLNARVEMKSAVLSLCSASGCPAGNQIMWNAGLRKVEKDLKYEALLFYC